MSDFFGKKAKKAVPLLFSFQNINMIEIDKLYNMDLLKMFNVKEDETKCQSVVNSTTIDRLGIRDLKYKPFITQVTKEKMRLCTYLTLMTTDNGTCDENVKSKCHGCHREFNTYPLGVPIKYQNSLKDGKLTEMFIVDSIVCSFNCMYLLLESSHSPVYKNSCFLIPKLYQTIFNEFPNRKILKSPHWKLRKCYGGVLSDEEYSRSLQTIDFNDLHRVELLKSYVIQTGRLFDIKEIT